MKFEENSSVYSDLQTIRMSNYEIDEKQLHKREEEREEKEAQPVVHNYEINNVE